MRQLLVPRGSPTPEPRSRHKAPPPKENGSRGKPPSACALQKRAPLLASQHSREREEQAIHKLIAHDYKGGVDPIHNQNERPETVKPMIKEARPVSACVCSSSQPPQLPHQPAIDRQPRHALLNK